MLILTGVSLTIGVPLLVVLIAYLCQQPPPWEN